MTATDVSSRGWTSSLRAEKNQHLRQYTISEVDHKQETGKESVLEHLAFAAESAASRRQAEHAHAFLVPRSDRRVPVPVRLRASVRRRDTSTRSPTRDHVRLGRVGATDADQLGPVGSDDEVDDS